MTEKMNSKNTTMTSKENPCNCPTPQPFETNGVERCALCYGINPKSAKEKKKKP